MQPARSRSSSHIGIRTSSFDVPWTLNWPGNDDRDTPLENNEKAEITVWILNRDSAVAVINSANFVTVMSSRGITSATDAPTVGDEFTLEVEAIVRRAPEHQADLPEPARHGNGHELITDTLLCKKLPRQAARAVLFFDLIACTTSLRRGATAFRRGVRAVIPFWDGLVCSLV